MKQKILSLVLCLCVLLGSTGQMFAVDAAPATGSEQSVQVTGAAESTATEAKADRTVYITKTGSKYHYANPCGNGTYYATTLSDAKAKGLEPCEKCVLGSSSSSSSSATSSTPGTVKLGKISKSGSSITVTWSKASGASKYRVYRKVPGGSYSRIAELSSSKTSYTNENLKPGTYTYTVRAVSSKGTLGGYDKTGLTASILPGTPKLSDATPATGSITVKWSKVSNANGYRVYRKTADSDWERIATIKSNSTVSYTDKTAKGGTKYTYTVRAYANTGNTVVLSSYNKTGVSASLPGTPKLVSATASDSSITVKWNKVSNANGYRVYRKTADSDWSRIATITSNDTVSYTDKTPEVSTEYTYTVRAYTNVGKTVVLSGYDKTGVSAVISIDPPAAPELISATPSKSDITVQWSKVSDATGYRVYRKTADSDWSRIATITSNDTVSYTDNTVDGNTEYIYTVRAYVTVGKTTVLSSYDKAGIRATVTVEAPASADPITATPTESGILIQWNEVADATGYRVYRKTADNDWERIATIKTNTTVSYTDNTAEGGTEYLYTVRAYAAVGKTVVLGSYDKAGVSASLPGTPDLTGISSSAEGITVKWSEISNADGYFVYRKTGDSNWGKIAEIDTNTTVSYTDETAETAEKYTYTVRSYRIVNDQKVRSGYDKTGLSAVGYMPAVEIILGADFCYDDPDYADVYICWTEAENVDGYIVYGKTPDGEWERVEKIPNDDLLGIEDEDTGEIIYFTWIEELDIGAQEYIFTVRSYKTIDGKEVKGAYDPAGVSTNDAEDISDDEDSEEDTYSTAAAAAMSIR